MKRLISKLLIGALLGPAALAAFAQTPVEAKRLIMKDGSYQIVSKWEVRGQRVRYYSTERFDWEEVPNSLIDWAATEKYNKEGGRRPGISAADVAAMEAEQQADRAKDEAISPTVAPGMRLPETGGVFLMDSYHGSPSLVELVQNGGELNKQTGKNIMRAIINPLPTGPHQSIELKGTRARVQTHQSSPTLYVDISNSDEPTAGDKNPSEPAFGAQGIGSAPSAGSAPAQSAGNQGSKPANGAGKTATASRPLNQTDRFKIVRLQTKKDTRLVSNMKISLLGKVSNQQDVIPTTAEPVNAGEWVKVVPIRPLDPGEYALVEMLGPKEINMYVWDFGYDPTAPANPSAWKPVQPKPSETGTNETPILTKRPK